MPALLAWYLLGSLCFIVLVSLSLCEAIVTDYYEAVINIYQSTVSDGVIMAAMEWASSDGEVVFAFLVALALLERNPS